MVDISSCAGLSAGVPVLACLSESASFLPSYFLLVIFFLIVYNRLNIEPNDSRLASTLFVVALLGTLMSAGGLLPDRAWSVLVVLSIGSVAYLMMRR